MCGYKDLERAKEYQKEYRQNHKDKKKEYYQNNKDKFSIKAKEYYQKNKEKIKIQRKEYYQNNKGKICKQDKIYYQKNKDRIKEYQQKNKDRIKEYKLENKLQVFNHYSNYDIKCNCCGERQMEFLSIDHINNDGAKHVRYEGAKYKLSGGNLVNWLIQNNFPSGFQILCMNCNWAKGLDSEHLCPHQKEKADIILNKT